MVFWGGCCGIPGWCLRSVSHENCFVWGDMADEGRDALVGWRRCSGALQVGGG